MVFSAILHGGLILNHRHGSISGGRARSLELSSEKKPYESQQQAFIGDIIDEEAAMTDFFTTREEWSSTFRFLAGESLPSATSPLIPTIHNDGADAEPWELYEGIPQGDKERAVLETFLNSMHQALLDIPVTDSYVGRGEPLENENDTHFLEEGRRMLAVSRFHVLQDNSGGSVESIDSLFTYCWSEMRELMNVGQEHTGSIILLPDYNHGDLRRFTEMNVARPLQWLGLGSDCFEVANLDFGTPAIRLIFKLDEMPQVDSE